MSLRDLMVNISFSVDTGPLNELNQQMNEMNSVMSDSPLDAFEDSTESAMSSVDAFGDSAVSSANEITDALGDITNESDNVGSSMGGLGDMISDNWGKITLASGAAGAGIEAMARKGQDLELQTGRIARSMDMTSSEVKDLATSMKKDIG